VDEERTRSEREPTERDPPAPAPGVSARAGLLSKVSAELGESLDPRLTLHGVLRRVVPAFADWGTATYVPEEGTLERVAVEHRDPARADACERYLHGLDPAAHAEDTLGQVALGRTLFEPRLTRERLASFAQHPAHLELLETLGTGSAILLPLRTRGRVLGVLSFLREPSSPPFDAQDLAFAEDVTHRTALAVDNARLFQAEREARAALEQAVATRDDFLSVASHELRTPLTALKLQLDGTRRAVEKAGPSVPEVVGERLLGLERQVQRLTGLIGTLLDFTRLSAGRLQLEPARVDLSALVREGVLRTREAQDPARASPLELDSPGALFGHWDPLRLEQVITNLLTNAVKYGRERPIHVRVWQEDATAMLAVRDEGIGIAPADQARVFERFERAASPRHYAGLGLGLWITRELVTAMGGRISVESAPGAGSTFTVALPLQGGEGTG
jgi:signal transduction histidine kinase